jgi:hypothetical protein
MKSTLGLLTIALAASLSAPGAYAEDAPGAASEAGRGEREGLAADRLGDGWRTSDIWERDDHGACQALQEGENVRAVLDQCARTLMDSVADRLDARGNLAWASSTGGVGAIAAAGAPALTLNLWIGLGLLPSFYEDLQGRPMAVVEYYAGYGATWIGQQYDELSDGRLTLAANVARLRDAQARADAAEAALLLVLDDVNTALADDNRPAGSPTESQLLDTKVEIEAQLSELARVRSAVRRILRSAGNALERSSESEVDQWAEGRFEHLRQLAIGQQLGYRVGPFQAFRTLVALPFGTVADTIRGKSTAQLEPVVAAYAIQSQLTLLPQTLGIQANADDVADITVSPGKIHREYRRSVAPHTVALQELVDAANDVRDAQAELVRIDAQTIPTLPTPNGGAASG